jgi:hypothetical protein
MSDSLTTVSREITRYKLDFADTQKDRWNKGGTAGTCDYIVFLYAKGNENFQSGTDLLYITEYYQQLRE